MPNHEQDKLRRRVRAAWRARVCAAAVALGAQIAAFGAGVAMTISLNAAWLSALPAIPLAMLAARLVSNAARRKQRRETKLSKALYVLLAFTLLLSAVFSLTALSSLTEQTLLPQARLIMIMLLALLFAALCALSGGTGISRLCFALRYALPAGLALFAALSVPMRTDGLFPILGAGKGPLFLSMACMPGALAPVLTLLLPPQEITDEQMRACPPPGGWFFAWRVGLGAACGAAVLFAICAVDGYEMIPEVFGRRLRLESSLSPEASLVKTMLTLLQLGALGLGSAHLFAGCEQAAVRAYKKLAKARLGLFLIVILSAACLLAIVFYGVEVALMAAPLLGVPAAILLLLCRRM